MNSLIDNLRAGLTRRTLYGLIALAALLGVWFALRLHAAADVAVAGVKEAQTRFAQYGGDVDAEIWSARAEEARGALAAVNERRWRGPTAGFLAAQISSTLNDYARIAGLEITALEVEPRVLDAPAGSMLRFRISGRMIHADTAPKLLQAIGANAPLLIIEEQTISVSNDFSGRFSATGLAPVLIEADQSQGPAG